LEANIPAPKQPKKLPVVLSRAEVLHFLGCVEGIKHQAILTTCYAAGLRISEAVRLKTSSAPDNHRRQKLSPLIDRINERYGRCAIGFGLFPPGVRAFKGHAAFHRAPESWEFWRRRGSVSPSILAYLGEVRIRTRSTCRTRP